MNLYEHDIFGTTPGNACQEPWNHPLEEIFSSEREKPTSTDVREAPGVASPEEAVRSRANRSINYLSMYRKAVWGLGLSILSGDLGLPIRPG